jgi:hypothetical protein
MPRTPDELLNDIAELRALLLAKDTALAAKDAELVAAKNGLIHSQLTIEMLKAQLARLRREKFGQSSERIERALEQLELALEEAEAGQAESTALAETTSPSTDQTVSPSAPASEQPEQKQKKRRTLPPQLPRRDVVHAPADVCKTCGGTELRKVGESVTEILAYIPGRFEVIRHVRPACSCRKCETMVQAPMPDLPIPRGMVDASFLAHIAVAKF